MAIKAYSPYGGKDFLNIADNPNLTMTYREGIRNTYKDELSICSGDRVIVEITGHNVSEAVISVIDGASARHRRLIREYLDYVDAGRPKDFKWSEQ